MKEYINRILLKRFQLAALLCALLLCCACVIEAKADGAVAWGIVPNTQQRVPQPPKGAARLLKEGNGIYVKENAQKEVFFTFDLGYEAGYTAQVLDILKQNNIKAVFFLCGNYLKEQELVQRMIDEGHFIGNHTDRHRDLPALSEEAAAKDIKDFKAKFDQKYSAPLNFFRPPQGRFDEKTLKIAKGEGMVTVLWSIAIVDWGKNEIDDIKNAQKIASRLHNGAIILLHITNAGTPKMLARLLPLIKENGFACASAAQLLSN